MGSGDTHQASDAEHGKSLAHWCTMAMWSIDGGDGRCTSEL